MIQLILILKLLQIQLKFQIPAEEFPFKKMNKIYIFHLFVGDLQNPGAILQYQKTKVSELSELVVIART